MGGDTQNGKSTIEAHAGKILVCLLVALSIGGFVWWRDMSIDSAVQNTEIKAIREDFSELVTTMRELAGQFEIGTRSRWTRDQHDEYARIQGQTDKEQDRAISGVQSRLATLENRVNRLDRDASGP